MALASNDINTKTNFDPESVIMPFLVWKHSSGILWLLLPCMKKKPGTLSKYKICPRIN